MDCPFCFRVRYESWDWDEKGDVLDGADNEGGDFEGELPPSSRGCDRELFCMTGLGSRETAGVEVSKVEIDPGEALSGFAMRRPPSEPDKSKSPFMMEQLHPNEERVSRSMNCFCSRGDLAASALRRIERLVEVTD